MPYSAKLIQKLDKIEPELKGVLIDILDEIEQNRIASVTKIEIDGLRDVVKELADAQKRTELRVEELAEAQKRTELRVEELAQAQRRTELRMEQGFASLSDQIAALGGRWGIYNEGTFRSTIYGLFKHMKGVEIKEGFYGGRQVDVVVRNGEHIILEITSRMHKADIDKLYRSADDYRLREGLEPKLMVATNYISPKLMQEIMGLERPIEVFSYESEQ